MKKFLLIILMLILVCGCENKAETKKVQNTLEYKELMENNPYIIVDVRTEDEYNSGHIVDAINIPVDKLNDSTDLGKDKLIFVYCLSGGRSQQAYQILTSLGYDVYDLGAYESIDLPKE